jgi:hypothetical protein
MTMNRKLWIGLLALATATGVAFAQDKDAKKSGAKKGGGAKTVNVRMAAQNKSKETGTAKLTAMGADKTKVEITLKGAPKGTPQPAHIHEGTCAKLDPKPKWGLENIEHGKSTTEVPVSLAEIQKGTYAVNVHKSGEDIKTYVSCGNIAKAGGAAKKSGKKAEK